MKVECRERKPERWAAGLSLRFSDAGSHRHRLLSSRGSRGVGESGSRGNLGSRQSGHALLGPGRKMTKMIKMTTDFHTVN